MKRSQKRISSSLVLLVLLVLLHACTNRPNTSPSEKTSVLLGVEEIHPGILKGYLEQEQLPNSLELLPPPPAEGSTAWKLDQEKAGFFVNLEDEKRIDRAIKDAELSFPEALQAFNGILPVPVSEESTPIIYMLLRRTLADAGLSTYMAKNHYQRARPFMVNGAPVRSPEDEESLRSDGSYPSGHTAIGWAWALVLCELFPDHADAILQRGKEFGISRNICNVHWHSDVEAGRIMGAVTVARLHANRQFLIDIDAAKNEML